MTARRLLAALLVLSLLAAACGQKEGVGHQVGFDGAGVADVELGMEPGVDDVDVSRYAVTTQDK